MSKFVQETINDIRGGRESWRVLAFFSGPSFVIAVAAALVQGF